MRRRILISAIVLVVGVIAMVAVVKSQSNRLPLVGSASFDPEARLVAFLVQPAESTDLRHADLYVFNPLSETTTQLTTDTRVQGGWWSPDGQFLTIQAFRGDSPNQDLYLLNVETGDLTSLTANLVDFDARIEAAPTHSVWSPVENRLAFAISPSSVKGSPGLYLADAASGEVTQIDLAGSGAEQRRLIELVWSPDGQELAFVGLGSEGTEVYIASIQTHGVRHLVSGVRPAWSPDGTRIAFVAEESNNMFVVSTQGGDPRLVTEEPGSYTNPVWSPNGLYLAFAGGGFDKKLYVTDFAETWMVTDKSSGYSIWAPDSTTLVYGSSSWHGLTCRAAVRGGEPDCSLNGDTPVMSEDFQWLAYVNYTTENLVPSRLCVQMPEGEESCTDIFDELVIPLGWRP